MSVDAAGKVFLNNTETPMEELVPKLKAIADARGGGTSERVLFRRRQGIGLWLGGAGHGAVCRHRASTASRW